MSSVPSDDKLEAIRLADASLGGGPDTYPRAVWYMAYNAGRASMKRELEEARDCGQDTVCRIAPGCQRHWEERNRELARERDEAREKYEAAQWVAAAEIVKYRARIAALEAGQVNAAVGMLREEARLRSGDVGVSSDALGEVADWLEAKAPREAGQVNAAVEMLRERARQDTEAAHHFYCDIGNHVRLLGLAATWTAAAEFLENSAADEAKPPREAEAVAMERLGRWLAEEEGWSWRAYWPTRDSLTDKVVVMLSNTYDAGSRDFEGSGKCIAEAINAALDAAEKAGEG